MPGECLAIIATCLDFSARQSPGRDSETGGPVRAVATREKISRPYGKLRVIVPGCRAGPGEMRGPVRLSSEQCHLLSGTDKQPSLTHKSQSAGK